MDTPSHALIPVIAYGLMRQEVLVSGSRGEKLAVARTALVVGLVGALPDMVDPHVTLGERLNSWSHCLVGWIGFSALLGLISAINPRWLGPKFAVGLSLTYLSHLIGDAIAGGLGWAYPFSSAVVGDYYVHPRWWIPLNFICAVAAYIVYRALPAWKRVRHKREVLGEASSRMVADAEARSRASRSES